MGTGLSRRRVVGLLGGVVAGQGGALPAVAKKRSNNPISDNQISDRQAIEILIEESEAEKHPVERTLIKPFWFTQPVGERPSPTWPQDNVSFDYAHLIAEPNSANAFEFTAALFERLLELNSFARDPQLPKVLFGLRGCMLPGNQDRTGFAASQRLTATRPNHIDPKCLIGVWDTTAKTIALFKASTVPCADLMEKQIEGSLACNMLPTGLHHYKVGPHRAPRQPGAFRQQTPLWVMRSKKRLQFATNDPDSLWDDLNGELPADNIHAAMLSSRTKPPFFSSAGCQVVSGAYDGNHNPTGAWADFRKAAGLHHPIKFTNGSVSDQDGQSFDYVLLTGKDAQLVADGKGQAVRALRYGSSGPPVARLQEKLAAELGTAVNKTGTFDRITLGAVIRWQVSKKIAPTGIIAAETARLLELNWT
jgi:endonuclease G